MQTKRAGRYRIHLSYLSIKKNANKSIMKTNSLMLYMEINTFWKAIQHCASIIPKICIYRNLMMSLLEMYPEKVIQHAHYNSHMRAFVVILFTEVKNKSRKQARK